MHRNLAMHRNLSVVILAFAAGLVGGLVPLYLVPPAVLPKLRRLLPRKSGHKTLFW